MIIKISKTQADKRISFSIMSIYIVLLIQYVLLSYFGMRSGENVQTIKTISKVFIAFFFINSLYVVLIRKRVFVFVSGLFFLVLFLLNYVFYVDNRQFLEVLSVRFFIESYPVFIYSVAIEDWNVFKDVMKKSSYLIFLLVVIISLMKFLGITQLDGYSMMLSYYALIPLLLTLESWFEKKKLIDIMMFLILFFSIVLFGSRGALISVVFYYFIKKLEFKKFFSIKGIVLNALLILFLLNIRNILLLVYNYLLSIGIYSRSIYLFLTNITYLSGRERIYQIITSKIAEKPIFGWGIFADRVFLNGAYAHNFLLEILCQFGLMGGIFIISILLILIIVFFFKTKKDSNLFLMFFSMGLVPLFVSGSFWIYGGFWLFWGFLISNINQKKSIESA